MGRFVLDTGILLGYVRAAGFSQYADAKYHPLDAANVTVISAVSKGEILSLAVQFGWGAEKRAALSDLLAKIPAMDINRPRILERYAEIDAYSQGKFPGRPLPAGMSSRNMGKNDLWIAATASVMKASLLTIDGDFDHVAGVFLDVIRIDQRWTAADI